MGKKDKRELSDMFKALGDPTRLKIFLFLRGRCWPHTADDAEESWLAHGPTVSEVSAKVTGSKKITSKVSQHLKELRLAGLITIERRGKNMICGVNQYAVNALTALLNSVEVVESVAAEEEEIVEAITEAPVVVEPVTKGKKKSVEAIVIEVAEAEIEHPKSAKKSAEAETIELPVVDIELVKPRRKAKSASSNGAPPAETA